MTDQTQVHALLSVVTEPDMHWVDDNDDVVIEYFHGAFSTPELAMERALAIAEAGRQKANDVTDEVGDGEAHYPPAVLAWSYDDRNKRTRGWKSDTFEYLDGATHFLVVETDVDA